MKHVGLGDELSFLPKTRVRTLAHAEIDYSKDPVRLTNDRGGRSSDTGWSDSTRLLSIGLRVAKQEMED